MTTTAACPIKILLQTTIPYAQDDRHIGRFRLLGKHIAGSRDAGGAPLAEVTTRRPFNIAVAFEARDAAGRGWAESTFHDFCDYNWDIGAGCPSFVSEKPSDAIARDPGLLDDTKQYVGNLVAWLGRRPR